MRGYFGIGIYHPKTVENVGTLWRSAHSMGASFIFTIGRRYRTQASDTTKAWRSIPLFEHETFADFFAHIPKDCLLVGVEQAEGISEDLRLVAHPERAIYLLGAEDHGLPPEVMGKCHRVLEIPSTRCINVGVAGSIVLYDRLIKGVSQAKREVAIAAVLNA